MTGTAAARASIVAGLVLVLGLVNAAIAGKERIKRDGTPIFLELRPVDPRSLMQGDYMALRFTLADQLEGFTFPEGALPEGGVRLAPLVVDERGIASLDGSGRSTIRLRYRMRGGIWLGTNAFFFSEGDAGRFEAAAYGEFRLDRQSGEAVLVGLRDRDLKPM